MGRPFHIKYKFETSLVNVFLLVVVVLPFGGIPVVDSGAVSLFLWDFAREGTRGRLKNTFGCVDWATADTRERHAANLRYVVLRSSEVGPD